MILIWNGAAPERVGRKMRAMISDGSALNMCGNCMRDLRDQGRSLNDG
ncbi:MAG: diaminopimelate epimerase [Akkermansiaceae bacterium]|jgi:diaminopimelate epimerase